jgi:hypothetical protein
VNPLRKDNRPHIFKGHVIWFLAGGSHRAELRIMNDASPSRRFVSVALLFACCMALQACSIPGAIKPPILRPEFQTQFAYLLAGDGSTPWVATKVEPSADKTAQPPATAPEAASAAPEPRPVEPPTAPRAALPPLRASQTVNFPAPATFDGSAGVRRDPNGRPYFVDYYQSAVARSNEAGAGARNEILHDLIAVIDANYREFEMDLRGDRNVKDVLVRTAAMTLSGTAAVMDAGSTGRILSAISGGLIGANAIVDEEIFLNYSTQLIQMQMQLDRSTRRDVLEQGMTRSVGQYPLGSALCDVVDYYYAGTVTNALHQLVVRKGAELQIAQTVDQQVAARRNVAESERAELLARQKAREADAKREQLEAEAKLKNAGGGAAPPPGGGEAGEPRGGSAGERPADQPKPPASPTPAPPAPGTPSPTPPSSPTPAPSPRPGTPRQ